MKTAPFNRIVTGHDKDGKAIIQECAPPPRVQKVGGETGPWFYEVWNTLQTPVLIDADSGEPHEDSIQLDPPKGGTRIRVLDIPPDDPSFDNLSEEERFALFDEIGAGSAMRDGAHAHFHRTETVDYGIVLQGEIYLIMDEGEVLCRQGDIIIQRGTNHGWSNRSDKDCRIAFVLIDGKFDETIA